MEKLTKNLIPLAIIIAVVIIAGAIIYVNPPFLSLKKEKVLSGEEVGERAINYINQNVLQGQATASLNSFEEERGLYKFKIKIDGQEIIVYATKDGKFLFPELIDLESQPPSQEQEPESPVSIPSLEGDPILGSPDAPVTIIEFSEFQCPFCGRYANETFPKIKEDYADTGKVKIVFKNFPLPSHDKAQKAAEAGECALEQGKFWEYKEKLFQNQQALSVDDLKKHAQDLGLNIEQFNSCLDSGKFAAEVGDDLKEGQAAGVSGTPTFLINGEKLLGAQPFSEFQRIIEDKLK
jgi:protein-disulfide isomerase